MTLGKFLDLSGPQLNHLGNRAHGIRCRYHRIISVVRDSPGRGQWDAYTWASAGPSLCPIPVADCNLWGAFAVINNDCGYDSVAGFFESL